MKYYRNHLMRKPQTTLSNYFDFERWVSKYDSVDTVDLSPTKIAQSNILSKSCSTAHIPAKPRDKYSRRVYAQFDGEVAQRMFGYRVVFDKGASSLP